MECTQPIKVLFPKNVFMNTETNITIPKSGDIVKKIRLVMSVSTANTLGEKIINECELIQNGKTIEKIYGDFLHVDNLIKTPIEKRDTLDKLLCKNNPGTVYLEIPFKEFFMNSDTVIRILFGQGNSKVDGYLLVDYSLISNPPTFPFFQKVRQIQKLSIACKSSSRVTTDVYLVGPVYELYFTVTDSNGNLIDLIKNIRFLNGSNERFNLTGDYLRLLEPMKRHGRIAPQPVYTYSFAINPEEEIPNGQTFLKENQRFVFDLYDNDSEYTITIYAQSHNFYYATQSNTTPVFESHEMLISSTTNPSTITQIPLKTSYTNYANTVTVSYTSDYEIENVNVVTNIQNYIITQNEINFSGIDSINGSYYANVTYSSRGFSNLTCEYNFKGSNVVKVNNLTVTNIDGAQRLYKSFTGYDLNGTVLCNSNANVSSLFYKDKTVYINEYRDYFVSFFRISNPIRFYNYDRTYVDVSNNSQFTLVKYTSKILIKYILSALVTYYCSKYNTDIICFSNPYTYSSLNLPTLTENCGYILNIKNNAFNYITSIKCGTGSVSIEKVCFDSNDNIYVSGITEGINPIIINNTNTINITGTSKTFFMKFDKYGTLLKYLIVDNITFITDIKNTSVDIGENDSVFFSSYIYSSNVYSQDGLLINASTNTNGCLLIKFDSNGKVLWNKQISNIGSSIDPNTLLNARSGIQMSFNKYFNTLYLNVGCGKDGSPYIQDGNIQPSSIEIILKLDTYGNTKWVISITSDLYYFAKNNKFLLVDQTSGNINLFGYFLNNDNIYIYLNRVLITSYNLSGILLNFDSSGNIINSTTPKLQLSDFFSVVKDPYYTPLYDGTYFQRVEYPQMNMYGQYGFVLPSNTTVQSISSSDSANVYVTGTYSGRSLDIDGIVLSNSVYSTDVFITNINSIGSSKWATKIENANVWACYNDSNVYVACSMTSNAVVYNSDGTVFKTLVNSGNTNGFITKYYSNGMTHWISNIISNGGTLRDYRLKMHENYVTGVYFSNSISIYNSNGTISKILYPSSGNRLSAFIVRYDTNGDVLWASNIITTTGTSTITGCAGSISCGFYVGNINIYNSDGSIYNSLPSYGSGIHGCVIKYDSSGFVVPNSTFTFMYPSRNSLMNITQGSFGYFYVCGYYELSANVYNSDQSIFTKIPNATSVDGFIIKYNSVGSAQWISRISGPKSEDPYIMKTDSFGSLYVCGGYDSEYITIYDSDGNYKNYLPNTNGVDAVFIIRYNQNGYVELVIKLTGVYLITLNQMTITVDSSNNMYIGGIAYTDLVAYNTDGSIFRTFTNTGGFMIKYND